MIHQFTLKVRSYELDGNNHVNNANYLNYLEAARISFFEDIGINYKYFLKKGTAYLLPGYVSHTKFLRKSMTKLLLKPDL